ncbi:extracellular solute-binding protein [Anderseniella sp. Alg231-50]|uniref:extracellular solute-binding protein n=1 Tax=Anderseniella sp. Alg231-50 TaxID=1922226 RepID=UPI00307BFF4C
MYKKICASLASGLVLGVVLLSGSAAAQSRWNFEASDLAKFNTSEIATIQRLLRRLGHLSDADMTRKLDERTVSGLLEHLKKVNFKSKVTSYQVIRSLFRTAWVKEGWGAKKVAGQDLVVEPEEVRAAQDALRRLGYAPGPADGVFGPATFSGVEIFQEDNDLNVTGLLTRNTEQSILRRNTLRDETSNGVVKILNWPDYIDPNVLTEFEKETKIKVVHEVFESSDETFALLKAGSAKYDVMVQTDTKLKQLVDEGKALTKLNLEKLPNSKHLDKLALTFTSVMDPGNKHSLPYMWGTVGIAVNETKLRKVRTGLDLDSMSLFMDPSIAADVSRCGLALVDEPADMLPILIAYHGGDVLDIKTEDLQRVEEAVSKVAEFINVVSSDRIIDDIAEGKYCVAVGYSGDVFAARDTAAENGTGKISYHVPATGSLLWFDRLVIPGRAQNVDAAYKFINFLMRPKIAAANTNFLQYASPNTAAKQFVEAEIRNNPGVYPPPEVMKNLRVVYSGDSVEVTKAYNRIWSLFQRRN